MSNKEDVIKGVSIHNTRSSIWLNIRIGDVQSVSDNLDNTIECVSSKDDFDGDEGETNYWDELYLTPEEAVTLGNAVIKKGEELEARNYTEAEISLGLI